MAQYIVGVFLSNWCLLASQQHPVSQWFGRKVSERKRVWAESVCQWQQQKLPARIWPCAARTNVSCEFELQALSQQFVVSTARPDAIHAATPSAHYYHIIILINITLVSIKHFIIIKRSPNNNLLIRTIVAGDEHNYASYFPKVIKNEYKSTNFWSSCVNCAATLFLTKKILGFPSELKCIIWSL